MFRTEGMRIRDQYGRQRIFKGINLCFKYDRMSDHIINRWHKHIDEVLDALCDNGVNIIRLGFTWAALEPEENEYDQRMFDFLKFFVDKCRGRGIYIVLDTHQDLFCSKFKFGDGAPEWVTKDYARKSPVAIWAEGYFYVRDVQRAFNDFWRNKNDIQSKFIKLWGVICDEFKDYENVIALDYLNEPMITDNSNKVFCTLVNNAVKVGLNREFHAERYFENGRERSGFLRMALAIALKVRTIGNLKKFLKAIDDYDAFSKIVDSLEQYTKDFNSEYFQPFIDEVSKNRCNENCIALFEHNYYSNLGVPFTIEPGDNYVYSPHAYDLFIDSALYNSYSSNARVKYILDSIRQNQLKMNVPVIMGEWGGSAHKGNEWIKHVDYVYSLIEKNQWSSIYWNYLYQNKEFTRVMNRPYPCAVCGDIVEYSSNSESRHFALSYICNDNTAPTIVYVPGKGYVEYSNTIGENIIEIDY